MGLQPVALHAKGVDLVEHAPQKGLGRSCRDAGALQLKNILPLLPDLDTHALDFRSEVL